MRLAFRLVTCSAATLVGVACSGTTVTSVERKGDPTGGMAGAAGSKLSTRLVSSAGNGGQSAAHSGGNTDVSSGRIPTAGAGTGGASGATNQFPMQGGGAGGVIPSTSWAGSAPTTGGGQAKGGAGGVAGSSTGGSSAAAGRSAATGGSVALGGSPTSGGTAATGGGASSGGSAALGGSVSTGGTTTVPAPSIVTVSPSSGIVTTTVVISGQNFGDAQGGSTVTVAGSSVTPTYWSSTSVEVPIPRSVYPGSTNIAVTVGGKPSNNASFDVLLPRTIYVNKGDSSTAGSAVSAFSLNSFGMVAQLQNSPYPTGDIGTSGGSDLSTLALHRTTRRLFALNGYSIAAFDIDPITGQLVITPNSPVSTGAAGASGVAVNAAGNLVFVANMCSTSDNCRYHNPSISVFKVSATGILSALSGSPFAQSAGGGGLRNPALVHGDQFLVATGDFDSAPPFNRLVVNSVNSSTGALTPVTGSPFDVGSHSWSARVDPSGMWYYMSDMGSQLTGYGFQNSGPPVLISGMPIATRTTSTMPNSVAISTDGSHLYMGSYDSNEVSVFSLSAGSATLLADSPRQLDNVSAITALGVSRSGSQLVVAESTPTAKKLMVYPINSGFPYFTGQGGTVDDVGGASGLVVAE